MATEEADTTAVVHVPAAASVVKPTPSGKQMSMMARAQEPPRAPAPAAPAPAPVQRAQFGGKQPSSLPPSRVVQRHAGGKQPATLPPTSSAAPSLTSSSGHVPAATPVQHTGGKQTALLARQRAGNAMPAPATAPPQPTMVHVTETKEEQSIAHGLPILQRLAQEYDRTVTLSTDVAEELLKSTTPLIRNVVSFAAKLARRRADASAKAATVEVADLRAAVRALYPHLNGVAGATAIDVARVQPRQPAPIAVGREVLKKQRIDAGGGAVVTSSASADPKTGAGASPSDQAK